MKKIININLSGRVIPIEDSAYENLQSYIESLRRYFANEESREEIINDIESRIAELMSEKVRKGANCITDADVEEIISSMGRPEDFEAEEASQKTTNVKPGQSQQQSSSSSSSTGPTPSPGYSGARAKRRLYRDSGDRLIGGVCSGIAAYLNLDPSIVRILFAIITFGGFGFGILVYILLWIVLPPKDLEGFSGKRLYRNPDDRIIGGVAGGLAAYFNTKTSTIRLIFAAPLVLSILFSILDDFEVFPGIVFGSFTGTFALAYLVLWIVLPQANSPYEKMEMRGEKVDVNRIRQNVKESAENMKERVQGWSEEVKESAQNFSEKAKEFANTRGRTFANEFGETARRGGRGLGNAIGGIFRILFLFVAGAVAFGFLVGAIILILGGIFWWPINNFLWTSQTQQWYAWGTLIFFFLVPLIAFIIWIVRRVVGVRSKNNYLGWTFGFLWAVGWVIGILFAISISSDLRKDGIAETPIVVNQPAGGKMIVTVTQPKLSYTGQFDWINDGEGWDMTEDTMRFSNIGFSFKKSDDSLFHVTVWGLSLGRTKADADQRAARINYEVISKDSLLDLANGFAISKESKFRGQHVMVEIQIPVGKRIRFTRHVNDKLNPADFDFGSFDGRRFEDGYFYYRHLRPGKDYIMEADGNLRDQEGKKVNDNIYRYDDNENDSIRLKRARDIKQRELDELNERIKQSKSIFKIKKSNKVQRDLACGPPSPVISGTALIN
jgi:phage shock protein PspC (stress-responsive transcriptional regulator)